ncbi:AAA family ATPase [Thiovibrio frasassiensis]|uniref:AAA family ATPase n=1 Tax=Thiovibrio frasassiensis TaxID=2984131 RepID=A0A9X4MDL3_9BACT|nr:AAA family ATPase [Thiovibrio frasassiensis]MDG4475619.1 AAA family ATPase [Thiovibrio frasassiensis]
MLKQDLIEKNPIRHLKGESDAKESSRMGLVMARPGVGKTALLVQIALDSLMNDKQVVHVSVGQSLDKTKLWYDDMFKDIADGCKLENAGEIHDSIMKNRMIITFNESKFSLAKLEERLHDLVQQNVITPSCMVVDGFDFAQTDRKVLEEMRELAKTMDLQIWFSAVCTDGNECQCASGVPAPCKGMEDLFNTVVLLQPVPQSDCIDLKVLKGSAAVSKCGKLLKLDTRTFMIREDCK